MTIAAMVFCTFAYQRQRTPTWTNGERPRTSSAKMRQLSLIFAKSVRGIIVLGDRRGDKKGSEHCCRLKQSTSRYSSQHNDPYLVVSSETTA